MASASLPPMDDVQPSAAVIGYTYDVLDARREQEEIRLLAFPTNDSSRNPTVPLSCSIVKCVLHEVREYFAVSYAWGDLRTRRQMKIDGLQVQVPAQAEEALRYLLSALTSSHEGKGDQDYVYLWIDALCINQADKTERSQQVAIMSEIYASAKEVLVFLGSPFDGQLETMQAITDVATQLKDQHSDVQSMTAALSRAIELPVVRMPPALTKERLLAFYSSRWFTRLWVLQEVALSKRAVAFYGIDSIVLTDAIILARYLAMQDYQGGRFRNRSQDRLAQNIDHCRTLYRLRFFEGCQSQDHPLGECSAMCYGGMSLAWLLQETHDHLNSEPRDKVYAILGLCSPDVATEIVPDYELPVPTIYTQAARLSCIANDHLDAHALDGMRLARLLGNKPTDWYKENNWPTWVPLWYEKYDPLVNPSGLPWWAFDASESDKAQIVRTHLGDPVLRCNGVLADDIVHVSRPFLPVNNNETMDDLRTDFHNAIDELLSLAENAKRPDGQSHIAALGLTLIGGYYPFFGDAPAMGETHLGAVLQQSTSLRHLVPLLSQSARDNLDNGEGDETKYLLQFRIHSRFRSVFFTRQGYIGFGSQHVMKGDEVCIPFGSAAPWVLRREGGYYVFLGPGYVHGIMEGEFMRQSKDNEVQCFEIR